MKNFEDITFKLTSDELEIVPLIVERFRNKPGISNIITNAAICRRLKARRNIETNEPRVRKIVQYIRLKNILPGLIATSKGYYLTSNPIDLVDWLQSMNERRDALNATIAAGERDLQALRRAKQTSLFNGSH